MRRAWSAGALVFATSASPALAHSPVPGIEGFYLGLLHPVSTPPQALLMLGLGLMAGALRAGHARWALGGFLAGTLLGVALGSAETELDVTLYTVAILAAGLAALAPDRLSAPALVVALAVAVAGGVLIGMASIPDPGPARDRIITTSGSLVGANLGMLYLFGFRMWVRERYAMPWIGIAFRVVAAWIGAISLVMLALQYAPTETAM